MCWCVGNLVHAIVVEEDKRTSRRSENGIPAAPQYCPRVVTLDALPAVQFNRKWLEWPARRQRIKDFLEMVYGHFLPSLASSAAWPHSKLVRGTLQRQELDFDFLGIAQAAKINGGIRWPWRAA
jgi:hypothetical protein